MKSNLSPIEELRLSKSELITECEKEKDHLLENIDYAKGNLGRLLVNSLITSKRSTISNKNKNKNKNSSNEGNTFFNIKETLLTSAPLLWEIGQPLLIGLVMKKIKSMFSKKKKKNKE